MVRCAEILRCNCLSHGSTSALSFPAAQVPPHTSL
jgi:hypothetical protein